MTVKRTSDASNLAIVMSVFNEGKNIATAIDSILSQSYRHWDLIIVDDGSTDDTVKVIQSYTDQHNNVQLLSNRTNLGLAHSLNKAIKNSDSEYIARMDADDIAFPNRLEAQISYLESHPEIDVLGTGAKVVSGSSSANVLKPEHHDEIVASIEKINPFFHSSVTMRRGFIESVGGYDAQCLRAQDYDLWLRGVDNAKYHNLPEVLMIYTSRNQSFLSIIYGLRVRLVNSQRRGRMVVGSFKATLVFIYGLSVKILKTFK